MATALFFLFPLSVPFNFHRYVFDDVSKVTLLAWLGRVMDTAWLFLGTLSPVWFLFVLGYYLAFFMILYTYCIICILESSSR